MKRKYEFQEENREDITERFGIHPLVWEWRYHFTYYRCRYIMTGKYDSRLGGTHVSGLYSEERQCDIPVDTQTLHSDLGRAQVAAHKLIDAWHEANADREPSRGE